MTRCVKKQQILDAVPNRKPGYLEEADRRKQAGNDSDMYCFEEEDFMFLRQHYSDIRMPSLPQQAKNFATAIGKEIFSKVSGEQQVTKEEVQKRMDTCEGCEFFTPNIPELSQDERDQKRCVKCGCFMVYKKWLTSSGCPVGKW